MGTPGNAGIITLAGIVLASTPGAAAAQAQTDCEMAGTSIRVHAAETFASPRRITYMVTNHRREPLRWVRIGSGGTWQTELAAHERVVVATTPEQWRGRVELAADGNTFSLFWEATTLQAGLAPESPTAFGIDVIGQRRDKPVSFILRPFTAGTDSGCWWGWTTSAVPSTPPGGRFANTGGVSVRPFASGGRDYVIVDAPSFDAAIRLNDSGLFLTIPVTFSWGLRGGFSHNFSIGVGARWSPIEYFSLYAQTHAGTFLFTNGTRLRHVGLEVNLPRVTVSKVGVVARDKYLVLGIEYFDRQASRRLGFLEGPQWYASGRGVAIRLGIRTIAWSR